MRVLPTLETFSNRLVVRGGHDDRSTEVFMSHNVINVDHDSYEYTGLIEVVSSPLLIEGWTHLLCVQDTMELGLRSYSLCRAADPLVEATAAAGWICNLVLYRVDYLLNQREFILARRNCGKHDAIRYEGSLWKMSTNRRDFNESGIVNMGISTPYSEIPRLKEYYPALDIVKWKANYGQNMHALFDSP